MLFDRQHQRLLEEIEQMNEVYGPRPQCYFLCLHLNSIFDGQIWYNVDHCLFSYKGSLYDNTGEVRLSGEEFSKYKLLGEYGFEPILKLQEAMFETNGRLKV